MTVSTHEVLIILRNFFVFGATIYYGFCFARCSVKLAVRLFAWLRTHSKKGR